MAKVNLASIAEQARQGNVELSNTKTVTAPMPPEERKTIRNMVNLKPSEYEEFVSMIGRDSFSEATRQLILDFIKNGKNSNYMR